MGYRAAKKECGRTLIQGLLGQTEGELNTLYGRSVDLNARKMNLEIMLEEVEYGKQSCDR